jgi:alkanesulfonate monooxygenase SsuD/methylene tetrahydromethanopterin reductase-like flavin-dependent oxidoreductase (luciferase family)
LATVTRTAKLGTLVTGVTYRNPALVAKMTTTLDVISGGRAILGIGAAWHDIEHEALGYEFPPAGERLDRLEEALKICRAMFTEAAPTFAGRYYHIKEAHNMPRPIQAGGPPIMVGGGGEKRTLRLVAQYADLCNISGDAPTIRHKLEVLRGHCKDVGRDVSEITVTRLATLVLTDSPSQTTETKEFLASVVGAEGAAAFNVGQDDEVVAQVGELVEAGVDEFLFNLPLSGPDVVGRAGRLLTTAFAP